MIKWPDREFVWLKTDLTNSLLSAVHFTPLDEWAKGIQDT